MINMDSIVVSNKNVLTTLVDDDLGMMNVDKGYYYTLNAVGKEIWEIIEEKISVREILKKLTEIYDVEKEQCYNELVEILELLKTNELINILD